MEQGQKSRHRTRQPIILPLSSQVRLLGAGTNTAIFLPLTKCFLAADFVSYIAYFVLVCCCFGYILCSGTMFCASFTLLNLIHPIPKKPNPVFVNLNLNFRKKFCQRIIDATVCCVLSRFLTLRFLLPYGVRKFSHQCAFV